LLNSTNNLCYACNPGFFPNRITQACVPCLLPCFNCYEVSNNCTSCIPLHTLKNISNLKACRDLCGDTYIVTDSCDQGLGIINDGCSD